MTSAAPGTEPPVAVICGNGVLPAEVIAAAQARGRAVLVVGIKGEADPVIETLGSVAWLDWGQIGRLFTLMKNGGVRELVLIGGVSRRPDFRSVVGDLGTMRRLPRILKALKRGDDGVLQGIIRLFEEEGLRVIGAHEIAGDLLVREGALGRHLPGEAARRDIAIGARAARQLGALDIGQAAVVVNGRVIAVEAAEGTDGMLRRCAELRASGRARWQDGSGVLVKCVKPQQDLRVDLPSIGERTVELAAGAGLGGIAVDADRVLCAGRDRLIARADEAGLFVIGIARDNGDAPYAELIGHD